MIKKLHLLILVVFLVWSMPSYAQSNSPAETRRAADAELREKAFATLELLAGQLGTLQSGENRARIGSNLAASLWPHNEKRARDLFALVQQDISAGLRVPEHPDPENTHTLLVFMKLRSDTIERMAKHDPELAYSFFKATQFSQDQNIPFAARRNEDALELQLAKKLAASNPDLSLELGLKLLERPLSNSTSDHLRYVLRQLNRKHKDEALVLYKAMVRKLQDADLAGDWEARYFAVSLVNSVTPPAIDEATFRDLVGLFIKTAITNGCNKRQGPDDEGRDEVCRAVGAAVPQIAKFDPSRANQLKRWQPEGMDSDSRFAVFHEVNDLIADGTVDDLVALAAQAPAAASAIKWRAAMKAQANGDYDRARKLIRETDIEESSRNYMLLQIDREEGRVALDEQKLAEAQRHIAEAPQLSERVRRALLLVSQIALQHRANALKILDQTADMLEMMKPGAEQSRGQLQLAVMYCSLKSDRGLAIMESMVPKLNELVAASAKLDGYGMRYLRDGEWNMTGEGPVGDLLTKVALSADYFAWCDFDRAMSAAAQFERAEIRMMAQLKLAQGILDGQPRRTRQSNDPAY